MMQGYNVYVTPDKDYPVVQFLRKHDEKDNAIGYQKSAFVFHHLRREIGEEAFWRGLKTFVRRYRDHPADWGAIEAVFSEESHQNLRWFFEQWIERPGAPSLSFGDVDASRAKGINSRDVWHLTVRIEQEGKPFRMAVPIRIVMEDVTETRWVELGRPSEEGAKFVLPLQPLRVDLDPDLMVFRRLGRAQLPPMLNGYVTDPHRTVVRAFSDSVSPLQQVVARIADQESQLPESQKTRMVSVEDATIPFHGSVLVLAGADQYQAIQSLVQGPCDGLVTLGSAGFQIDGQMHEGPTMAVLFSCHRTTVPGSVITVLYGVTPQAVAKVSRLLFYYGWQSYVVFHEGVVVKRELWQSAQEAKEVRIDAGR
jgi:hypothetical protein